MTTNIGKSTSVEGQARCERYGFTPAEAAVAFEIVAGSGQQATADQPGIAVGPGEPDLYLLPAEGHGDQSRKSRSGRQND